VPNRDALPAIYETGSGTILLRGRAHTEPGPDGEQLMITQLPYGVATVGAGGLIEQIADAVHQRTLEGITDLRYDTSDENGLGIVLELALGTDADATVDALHEQTDLQITYPVRLVARVESQPLTLTLRDLISGWVGARLLDRSKDALRQQLLAVAERHSDPRRTAIS
jgi:DNA gyrase subunit A